MTAPRRTRVWLAHAATLSDEVLASYLGWLGDDERARHARFVRAERRTQFVAGRALLRRALGAVLGVAPPAVRLRERPGLGPQLVHPDAFEVGFSISHSGPWIACAVSLETAVGLDIERVDPARDVPGLAEQAFGPAVAAQLAACGEPERSEGFYRLWCAHEARIKLGAPSSRMIHFRHEGVCGALACALAPAADPPIETVRLDAFEGA